MDQVKIILYQVPLKGVQRQVATSKTKNERVVDESVPDRSDIRVMQKIFEEVSSMFR